MSATGACTSLLTEPCGWRWTANGRKPAAAAAGRAALPVADQQAPVSWLGLGPHENYPDRRSSACFACWEQPLAAMTTPISSRRKTACAVIPVRWTGALAHQRSFPLSVQPWSTRQLMETDHWHKMQAEDGVWIPRRPAYGVGGDDSGPQRAAAVAPEPNALAVRGLIALLLIRGATAPPHKQNNKGSW